VAADAFCQAAFYAHCSAFRTPICQSAHKICTPEHTSPNSAVKGFGVPLGQLTFGLLVFPGIWDWYLQWREKRRDFYTKWEEDMLQVLLGMVRPDTGWMWQHPELAQNVKSLITAAEIASAQEAGTRLATCASNTHPSVPKKSNGWRAFTATPSNRSCRFSRPKVRC
jgi:hypothetical protein